MFWERFDLKKASGSQPALNHLKTLNRKQEIPRKLQKQGELTQRLRNTALNSTILVVSFIINRELFERKDFSSQFEWWKKKLFVKSLFEKSFWRKCSVARCSIETYWCIVAHWYVVAHSVELANNNFWSTELFDTKAYWKSSSFQQTFKQKIFFKDSTSAEVFDIFNFAYFWIQI